MLRSAKLKLFPPNKISIHDLSKVVKRINILSQSFTENNTNNKLIVIII